MDLSEEQTRKLEAGWVASAKTGDPEYMSWLVHLYCFGSKSVPKFRKDIKQGVYWLRQLEKCDDRRALRCLGMIYSKGIKDANIHPDGIAALNFLSRAHGLGETAASHEIGLLYTHGCKGIKSDLKTAAKWYHINLQNGGKDALCNLGEMYLYGLGIEQDFDIAFELNSRSAALKDDIAGKCNVGIQYEKGYGVSQDYLKATEYYVIGAVHGSQLCAMNIAIMLARKKIPPLDPQFLLRLHDKPLPASSQDWLSYAMKEVTEKTYFEYRLAFQYDVQYQLKLARTNDIDALLFLSVVFSYGLLHNKQNVSRALRYLKEAHTHDCYARDMYQMILGCQQSLRMSIEGICEEVLNICVGYLLDLDLQLWQWDESDSVDGDVVMHDTQVTG